MAAVRRNPLPLQPALHLVEVDRPSFFSDVMEIEGKFPVEEAPKVMLSWREYEAIAAAAPGVRAVPTAAVEAPVAADGQAPFVDDVRLGARDMFALFEMRFLRGGPWSPRSDREPERVAVISAAMSRRLFDDVDTVGRRFHLAGRAFTVQGVVADQAGDKPYDVVFLRRERERIFIPFVDGADLQLRPVDSVVRDADATTYADFRAGDALWIKLWVELPDDAAKRGYAADLSRSGVAGAHFVPFAEARSSLVWVHPGYTILGMFADVILVASIFNLVRLLLAKFSARADQTGIHRAMGASRRTIIGLHLTEAKMIGLAGGFLGLLFGAIGVATLNAIIPDRAANAVVDAPSALLTILISTVIGGIAGAYPAWRATRIPPAVFLKRQ
jgi:putative ABC transport system permease protein